MSKKYLGINDISEYLGVTVNTLYSWVCQKRIPYIKVGRLVRFDMDRIQKWIEVNTVEPYTGDNL
ncbi:MAG: helix-turn-helix domain-containing protein [Candidatus Omnitrophica bacterium]|jgi:excisionase family DNA binding protein|nr:helix-turn-helix domain-containing protein [Candidatus Omnitrophota bacterium]